MPNVFQDSRFLFKINANDLEQFSQALITGNMWPPSDLSEETHQTSQNPSLRFDSSAWAEIVRVRWINRGKLDHVGTDKYTIDTSTYGDHKVVHSSLGFCSLVTARELFAARAAKKQETPHHVHHLVDTRTST